MSTVRNLQIYRNGKKWVPFKNTVITKLFIKSTHILNLTQAGDIRTKYETPEKKREKQLVYKTYVLLITYNPASETTTSTNPTSSDPTGSSSNV